ncbi:MAG: prepilin peptidase [Alphaproteobacteria bacterium]|nr:prepilin peptidase [Alphaproteobacteria bacterium]
MFAQLLLMMVVPALLAAAAVWDLASFTIPNYLSLALVALFGVFALTTGFSAGDAGLHLLACLVALAIGFTMFALNYIGGGDAKLFAALALWLGPHDLVAYSLVATMLGGVLTLTLLAVRQLPLPAGLARQGWILKLHDSRSGIPYGVALAAGFFVILPQAEIFRLAAIG